MYPFTGNLKLARTTVQLKFIFIVFVGCKTCVDIFLSIFLSFDILNQNRYRPKPHRVARII
ncbi:hypothetical protein Hanom_Chr14g01315561 [Helianthus anomalus]